MTDNTGRLSRTLGLRTRELVFGEPNGTALVDELSYTTTIDLAHVVMLAEHDIIPSHATASLLGEITRLRRTNFRDLVGMSAPRGVYLAYENYLSEQLGSDVGGMLHTGRSRNDMKATSTALRVREWADDFVEQTYRLAAVLLARGRTHRDVVTPLYTHFQAATPVTYGYYLLGIAVALDRQIRALRDAVDELRTSPLGASAVSGTDMPIVPDRTAKLLGFDRGPLHAVDAIASRDVVLRVLSATSDIAILLSRVATDLQLWSTAEFGLVEFPDHLVGGSSAMPQKRNAFLLEHVRAKASTVAGAWTTAAATMTNTPFTNSIEVGTEAVAAVWPGLHAAREAVLLTQVLVSGAIPNPERMARRAQAGFTTATATANKLVQAGVPFRDAHHGVGAAVADAIRRGTSSLSGTRNAAELGVDIEDVPPHEAVKSADRGGGPGDFPRIFSHVRTSLAEHRDWLSDNKKRNDRAKSELMTAISVLSDGSRLGRGA